LQNNLNRWYDPSIGRWLSEDPIGFAGGDANLYRYVGNAPNNAVDPAGLLTAVGWGIVEGAAIEVSPVVPAAGLVVVGPTLGYKTGKVVEQKFGIGEWIGNWWSPRAASTPIQDLDFDPNPTKRGPKGGINRGPRKSVEYDEDGWAKKEVDTGHDHNGAGDPHTHDWGRPYGGGRPTDADRGDARPWRPGDPPPPREAPPLPFVGIRRLD
jgi:uncharacterized protein RhaS with RHS repeats